MTNANANDLKINGIYETKCGTLVKVKSFSKKYSDKCLCAHIWNCHDVFVTNYHKCNSLKPIIYENLNEDQKRYYGWLKNSIKDF